MRQLTLIVLHKALVTIVIFTVALFASDLLIRMIKGKMRRGPLDIPITTLTTNLVRISVIAIALLITFSFLGIAIAPLLTALGVGSLAVALGLHETLSNFFAGLYILQSKIVNVNDYIQLDSVHEGFVMDIGLRAIHLKTLSNNIVYVPTAKASQSIITNYSHPAPDFSIPVEIKVDNQTDLEELEKITLATAKEVMQTWGAADYDPVVRFQAFSDAGISMTVSLRTKEMSSRLLLIHQFIKAIKVVFGTHGIKFATPQQIIHLDKSP